MLVLSHARAADYSLLDVLWEARKKVLAVSVHRVCFLLGFIGWVDDGNV